MACDDVVLSLLSAANLIIVRLLSISIEIIRRDKWQQPVLRSNPGSGACIASVYIFCPAHVLKWRIANKNVILGKKSDRSSFAEQSMVYKDFNLTTKKRTGSAALAVGKKRATPTYWRAFYLFTSAHTSGGVSVECFFFRNGS